MTIVRIPPEDASPLSDVAGVRYRGLTWDHPRGAHALVEASRRLESQGDYCRIQWDSQPLAGFEEHPIRELAGRYDLLIIDHPHLGEAVKDGALKALNTMFDKPTLDAWSSQSIGASFQSYELDGRMWALPLDAAAQTMAIREDLLDDNAPPRTWQDVIELAGKVPIGLCLAGPHALLMFSGLCIALDGLRVLADEQELLIDPHAGSRAFELLAELHARQPRDTGELNPIELLNEMASGDNIACCPLIFGYVNYAVPYRRRAHALRFFDAPVGPSGSRGSVLGGTGIAISYRTQVDETLLAHLRWLMSPSCQTSFLPEFDGQPSARAAYRDPQVNARWNHFYSGTAQTVEHAWVRPRHDGFIAFQREASALLRNALEQPVPASSVVTDLQNLYRRHRAARVSL